MAKADVVQGLAAWNTWFLLGLSDIRQRYKRSRFGQFWITLSTAIFIGGIGTIYSVLFKRPVGEYIPFIAINVTVWTLISTTLAESSESFISAGAFLRQEAIPKTIFVMRVLTRNVIAFVHNIVIIPVAYLIFLKLPSMMFVLAVPGIFLLFVFLFLLSLSISVLATRFRDLPQIIGSGLQLMFFATPIMWSGDQLEGKAKFLVNLNPFALLLRVISDPFHGRVPGVSAYGALLLLIAAMAAISLPLFARFRARIVYWL